MLEKHLRFWLNNAYSGQLDFIEPAFGSTVGIPDVQIPIGDKKLPVELKIGSMTLSGFLNVVLRPSQYHYHIMSAEHGIPTAVMVAVGASTKFDVFVFAGRHCENDAYKENVFSVANWQRWTDIYSRNSIEGVLRSIMRGYELDKLSDSLL